MKVMVVDEQILFREGVKVILHQTKEYEVIASVARPEEMIRWIRQGKPLPDAVLMELKVSDTDAIQTMKSIKDCHPTVRFITLMEQIDEETIVDAIRAGADGFLFKKHYTENLIQSIRAVHQGDTIISGSIAKMLANRIRMLSISKKDDFERHLEQKGYTFTKREADVAYLLKEGYTNQEIAKKLYLGEGTVKNYVSEIYNKLNVRIRADVIKLLQEVVPEDKR